MRSRSRIPAAIDTTAVYGPAVRACTTPRATTTAARVRGPISKPTARFASPGAALQARLADIAAQRARLSVTETPIEVPAVELPVHRADRSCTKEGWEKTVGKTDVAPGADKSTRRPELIELPQSFVGRDARQARATAKLAQELNDRIKPEKLVISAYVREDAPVRAPTPTTLCRGDREKLVALLVAAEAREDGPMVRFNRIRFVAESQGAHGPGF